jgi:hypothetical protein
LCAVGLNKGFIVTKREQAPKPSHRKGKANDRTKLIRDVVREVRFVETPASIRPLNISVLNIVAHACHALISCETITARSHVGCMHNIFV